MTEYTPNDNDLNTNDNSDEIHSSDRGDQVNVSFDQGDFDKKNVTNDIEKNTPHPVKDDSSLLQPILIEKEMKNSYLEYAMSVIVGRALPDARDGLKPVHRRILYSMHEGGYTANRPYKKSARIVGSVLAHYHPHSDVAVYDSLVRMGQTFSMRYLLIDGQGNYGSVDGDNPAAMRYTEARMTKLSMWLLSDIDKDTVDFSSNFDESMLEPDVLPTRLPNLLLNGSSGISVGMATNIPPHNLSEVIKAISALIDDPELSTEDIMGYIQGPDFPTGGIICGKEGIQSAYETGRGSVVVRSKVHIEESSKKGKKAIIVSEIPYQVNKANLIIKIADLVNQKKITGISDLRDESDRQGMRIYIELKRDSSEYVVLNQLYKHTALQNTFGINMVALVKGIPRTLSLKEILVCFIEHRYEVVTRRTKFLIKKAKERIHILEGLRTALDNIDAIIALIRGSVDAPTAKKELINQFFLSEKQAGAILDMRLQRLTGLERSKIEDEYSKLVEEVRGWETLLSDDTQLYALIKDELSELEKVYKDKRQTNIGPSLKNLADKDFIPNIQVAVLFSKNSFVKRISLDTFKSQNRGGRGVSSMTTREEDSIQHLVTTCAHNWLFCFTTHGRVFSIRTFDIPDSSRHSKGLSISHFVELNPGESLSAVIDVSESELSDDSCQLFMTTERGFVKKTTLSSFSYSKFKPIIAIQLSDDDLLRWVAKSDGHHDVILVTSMGIAIRFPENDVRSSGRSSRGVIGIRIKPDDKLVSMNLIRPDNNDLFLLIITKYGYGKNMRIAEFKNQKRGGIGVISLRFRKRLVDDCVCDAVITDKTKEIATVTKNGTLARQKVRNVSVQRRESQGVIIVRIDSGDQVIAVDSIEEQEDFEEKIEPETFGLK